jgi:tetratricopeptide (TPR) repeat protein
MQPSIDAEMRSAAESGSNPGVSTMFYPNFSSQVSMWYEASIPRQCAAIVKAGKQIWTYRSLALYLGAIAMLVYAFQEARTPVTMIGSFQLSKGDPPFNSEIVADAVRDGLKSILNEIDQEKEDVGLSSSETGLPDLRNILIPKYWHVQAPPRFAVEVKGISYERVVSLFRAVMRTETAVSGDVIVEGDHFILSARAVDAGPWQSDPQPTTVEGLRQASRDLAKRIVETQDPTLAGMALLKDEQVDRGLAAFSRALSQRPSDVRLKLNLCMAYGAVRRYDEAIDCYKGALDMKPKSRNEVLERLAQVYYLKGDRGTAIDRYSELNKQGYDRALLGLGEAWDDTGHPAYAVDVYDEFIATKPQDRDLALAHLKRSAALAHLGRHKEALEEYGKALRYAPRDLLILVHEGKERSEAIDVDAGIAELQAVVDENKGSDSLPFALLQLGVLLEKKGDWGGAIDDYQLAAKMRPTYVEARLKLAHALVHEGKQDQALDEYKAVAKLSANDLERGYSEMFANQWLADELRNLGKYSSAASRYQAVIQLKSDSSTAHCQLALILAKQGRFAQAVREYRSALKPAKLEQFNDSECLVVVDHVLDQALTVRGPSDRQLLAAYRNIKQGMKSDPEAATVDNAPLPSAKKGSIQQAVLRGPQ